MGKIALILQLQEQYLELATQVQAAKADFKAFTDRYGTSEQHLARLNEIKNRLGGVRISSIEQHPDPFDSRHNLRNEERRYTAVLGCPSCAQVAEDLGLGAIWSEACQIRQRNAEGHELYRRVRDLSDQHTDVAEEHSRGEGLLPSYYLRLDGSGRITATGSVRDFEVRGRLVLDEGTHVDYDVNGQTARAVFDSSEQLVAYHLGDGNWTVTAMGAAHATRIRFSGVHRGDQLYPHVDANKRVDGKKVRDKSGHHQEQSPGYGPEAIDIPVRRPD